MVVSIVLLLFYDGVNMSFESIRSNCNKIHREAERWMKQNDGTVTQAKELIERINTLRGKIPSPAKNSPALSENALLVRDLIEIKTRLESKIEGLASNRMNPSESNLGVTASPGSLESEGAPDDSVRRGIKTPSRRVTFNQDMQDDGVNRDIKTPSRNVSFNPGIADENDNGKTDAFFAENLRASFGRIETKRSSTSRNKSVFRAIGKQMNEDPEKVKNKIEEQISKKPFNIFDIAKAASTVYERNVFVYYTKDKKMGEEVTVDGDIPLPDRQYRFIFAPSDHFPDDSSSEGGEEAFLLEREKSLFLFFNDKHCEGLFLLSEDQSNKAMEKEKDLWLG